MQRKKYIDNQSLVDEIFKQLIEEIQSDNDTMEYNFLLCESAFIIEKKPAYNILRRVLYTV